MVCIDLIELQPYNTRNRLWISKIFQSSIRRFDGSIRANTFPVFIVQGATNRKIQDRSINFKLFPYLNQEGHSFGLIHIMDENYDHDLSVYYLDKCILVFREHFRPSGGKFQLLRDYSKSFFLPIYHNSRHSGFKLFASKFYSRFSSGFQFMKRQYLPSLPTKQIFHIPLGYNDKFAMAIKPDTPSITERKYKWSFCGDSFKSDRKLMLKFLSDIQPNFIYEYKGYMSGDSLSGDNYWEILTQSIFIPCPLGNINIETNRLFEALEAGAIPIILKSHAWQPYDYYKNLLGEHPIPIFSSWKEVELFLKNININSTKKLSENIIKWYASFKSNLQTKIQELLLKAAKDNLLSNDVQQLVPYLEPYREHLD